MEKKIKHRILYITVACLWGVAIYRTYMNYSVEEELLISESNSFKITPINAYIKDSFELVLPDVDPFLKQQFKPQIQVAVNPDKPKEKKSAEKKVSPPSSFQWPEIKYYGFVRNRQTNSTRCLIQIGGSMHQVNKGEIFQEIKILETWPDSVLMSFKNERKIFLR